MYLMLFRLGYFDKIYAREHIVPPLVSPLFVAQLPPKLAWKYSGEKSLKSIENLLMSTL